jgi:hypothetical protein
MYRKLQAAEKEVVQVSTAARDMDAAAPLGCPCMRARGAPDRPASSHRDRGRVRPLLPRQPGVLCAQHNTTPCARSPPWHACTQHTHTQAVRDSEWEGREIGRARNSQEQAIALDTPYYDICRVQVCAWGALGGRVCAHRHPRKPVCKHARVSQPLPALWRQQVWAHEGDTTACAHTRTHAHHARC